MNYSIEHFNLKKYNFKYAHWSHPYMGKLNFTLDMLDTQSTYLSKGDIVIDIGAHSGDTPTLYANTVGKEGKVISFEANPHAYEILEVNSKLNDHLNIIPINKAITETPGKYTFHYSDQGFCNGGFAEEIDRGIGATGHVVPLEVEGVNLTDWLEENLPKKEWEKISFIKIDTEGYDYKILRSNKNLFKQIRPILEVELYPALSIREVKEFYKILKEIGYEVFQQNSPTDCSLDSLFLSLKEQDFINIFKNVKSGEDIVAYPKEKVPKNKLQMEKITFCIPSKSNVRYLKTCIPSIRENAYRNDHDIIIFVDSDEDGTIEWLDSIKDKYNISYYVNPDLGNSLYGIGKAYDYCIEKSTTDIFMIFHADMMLGKNADLNAFKHLKEKTVVCSTRVEPPIHPNGGEKILLDFGMWPEEFKKDEFNDYVNSQLKKTKWSEGIFAPWMMYKDEFLALGGHDPIMHSCREDSDIFNRMYLDGFKFKQPWNSLVYHLTGRGAGSFDGDPERHKKWQADMNKSTLEFIRKWGQNVNHTPLMKPIVMPKYDIGFIVKDCNLQLLELLEPWCSTLYCDEQFMVGRVSDYVEMGDTSFDLYERIKPYDNEKTNEILVEIDGSNFTQQDYQLIQQLPDIIKDSGEIGRYELGNLKIEIIQLNEYQGDLIYL